MTEQRKRDGVHLLTNVALERLVDDSRKAQGEHPRAMVDLGGIGDVPVAWLRDELSRRTRGHQVYA